MQSHRLHGSRAKVINCSVPGLISRRALVIPGHWKTRIDRPSSSPLPPALAQIRTSFAAVLARPNIPHRRSLRFLTTAKRCRPIQVPCDLRDGFFRPVTRLSAATEAASCIAEESRPLGNARVRQRGLWL